MGNDLSLGPATPNKARPRIWLQRVVFTLVVLTTVVAAFYLIENWRGEKAWANYKKEIEARGENLDFDAFIPPTIPEDQNMLELPALKRWFSRANNRTAEPTIRIPETGVLQDDRRNAKPTQLAEWVEYFYSDIVPNYVAEQEKLYEVQPGEEVMQLITLEDAPLMDAIQILAKQAGLTIDIDSRIKNSSNRPSITLRWEKITSRQAFLTVLNNHNLKAIQDPKDPTNTLKQLIVINDHFDLANEQALLGAIASTNSLLQQTNGTEVMPLITIEDAPRFDAIKTLARQSGINFQFDPALLASSELYEKTVTLRRENISTRDLLAELLEQLNLSAVPSKTGIYRITRRVKTAGEILKEFEKFEPEFQGLYAACNRPKSRFNVDYRSRTNSAFNVINVRALAQSLTLRASAELALNKSDDALRDIKTCIRLGDCLTNEPNLVGGMVRVAIDGLFIGPVWEGLAAHRWNEKQLRELQEALARFDLVPDTLYSLRADRAQANSFCLNESGNTIARLLEYSGWEKEPLPRRVTRLTIPYFPRGWIYQTVIEMDRSYQETLEIADVKESIVSPKKLKAASDRVNARFASTSPYAFAASVIGANFSKTLKTAAEYQTAIHQAMIGCALERYRLAHGNFPETLAALSPHFLTKLPHDIVNGQSLKYRLTDDGQYVLYSVGWDEKDDGGRPGVNYWDPTGDWVWRFPEKGKSDSSNLRALKN